MTRTKFYILLSVELPAILLFNAIDYFKLNSATFNASGIKVILGWLIFFSSFILLIYFFKTRFSQYLKEFNQADTNFYNLMMNELDLNEISDEMKETISNDLILFLNKRSKKEADFPYSKLFKNYDYDATVDRSFQILSQQIVSEYKSKGKHIRFLKFTSLLAVYPVFFAYILNDCHFNASLFNVTADLRDSAYIFFLICVTIVLEKWTHFGYRQLLSFILNLVFLLGFSKISSTHFTNSFVASFMNTQIKFMPNLYVLIGYLTIIGLAYTAQQSIRKNIFNSIFDGNMLERTI